MSNYITTEIKRTYQLPKRYSIAFRTVLVAGKPTGFECDWKPDLPPRGKYYRKYLELAYLDARHDFFTEVSRQVGGACVVVDA